MNKIDVIDLIDEIANKYLAIRRGLSAELMMNQSFIRILEENPGITKNQNERIEALKKANHDIRDQFSTLSRINENLVYELEISQLHDFEIKEKLQRIFRYVFNDN